MNGEYIRRPDKQQTRIQTNIGRGLTSE